MTEEATIRRGVRNARYTTVPNHVFEDLRLSMEARWLLGYLLSKPDNWTVRMGDIRKKGNCGRDKARAMVSELVDAGYMEREDARKDGKFNGLMLVIYDEPQAARDGEKESVATVPQTDLPATVEPATANPPLVKTDNLAIPESTDEREARAQADEGDSPENEAPDVPEQDRPGLAEFEKRVMRFCNGTGFAGGKWPDWDTSSPGWIARQFAALSVEERAEAERWRDAYLLDMAARKVRPVTVGVFMRDKLWTGLDPAVLARAEKQKQARLKPEEVARPEGWAAALGPVGMAWLFAHLLDGPKDMALASRPFLSDPQLREAWPSLWWFQAILRQSGGAMFDPPWHGLKGGMEPVPQGSEVLAAWRALFAARGWRWLAPFDGAPVVYCPKGGPEGLSAFERCVGEAKSALGREAAE